MISDQMTLFQTKRLNFSDLSGGTERNKISVKQSLISYHGPEFFKYLNRYEYNPKDPEIIKVSNKKWPCCDCVTKCRELICNCMKTSQEASYTSVRKHLAYF